MADPLIIGSFPVCVVSMHAEYDRRFGKTIASVRAEIGQKLGPCVPPLKLIQGHRQGHGAIGYP